MAWPLVVFRLFYAVAMLLGPGYLAARAGRFNARFALAFPLSSVILFSVLFWIHACGFSLTFAGAGAAELAICAAFAVLGKNQSASAELVKRDPWMKWDIIFLAFAMVTVLLLAWRSLMAPLAGLDTTFRWDLLARQILQAGRYDFYPPILPADFRRYFYVDSIPPMVSFTYWWLYAAAGESWTRLAAIPVLLQYLSTLGLVFNIARHWGGVRSGSFAVAALAGSSLFFYDVAIAQETGLTALAMAGLLYAVCLHGDTRRGAMLGGMLAALAAMSREYGWAFLLCGCVALAPFPKKRLVIFISTVLACAGPWYIRTWGLSGNPFFTHPFFALNVNPVLAALLHFYRENLGIRRWTLGNWISVGLYLLQGATLQCTLGAAGLAILLRRRSDSCVAAAFITAVITLIVLWLYSVGETSGGPWYAIRVLSPALVILSITSGIAFAKWRYAVIAKPIWIYAALCALIAAWIYPEGAASLPARQWFSFGLTPWIHTEPAEQVGPRLSPIGFARSQQILSADAYLFAALLPHGYSAAPPWRPDLFFLFDRNISAAEARHRLIALGISAVEFDPNSIDTIFLDRNSNFFHELYHHPHGYQPLVQIGKGGILLLPDAQK